MIRKTLLFTLLTFQSLCILSQKTEDHSIFENPNSWQKEVVKFPIDWAPKFNLSGFEEILFAPNWSNSNDDEFWSLVIGWKIDSKSPLSLAKIEENLFAYFDGLMKPNHWAQEFPAPVIRLKTHENTFKGTMTLFDGFHTGKTKTINILGEQYLYKKQKKSVITFRLSPKQEGHKVWKLLHQIRLKNDAEENIIELDDTWGKELFPFPIRFAPSIEYEGLAEVRFPPKGWRDPNHPNFWSYTYAWNIHLNTEIDTKELEDNLTTYFDGLNNVTNKDDHKKALVSIVKTNKNRSTVFFQGVVKTYDRFATNKRIDLNVLIESNYCQEKQKTVILFKFSPKDFQHETWKRLKRINLVSGFCD